MAKRVIEVVIAGDASGLKRSLGGAQRDLDTFGSKVNAHTAILKRQQRTLGEIGQVTRHAATGLGIAAVGTVAAIIKVGASFEQQMSRVKAVTGANAEQMRALNREALKLGKDTKFSAKQAADAMYELASAGYTVHQTQKALPGVMALAAASNTDLARAAEISSNALRGFGLHAKDSTHVADVLTLAVNKSSVEMADLGDSMKYVGPISKATGQSFEDVTAAIAEMGNAGIKGEQAGTSLRGGLVRLVKPTKQIWEAFDTLGIKTGELYGPKGLKPLPEIIRVLKDHTEGLSVAQKNQALAQIFGTNSLSGMLAVVNKGPGALEKLSGAFQHSDGAAKKASKTMMDNVSGSFEQLKGSAETLGISLYEKFAPKIKSALDSATGDVNDFMDALSADKGFKSGDDVFGAIGRSLKKSGIEDDLKSLDIGGHIRDALHAAVPVVAKGAGQLGVAAVKGFIHEFASGDLLTKVALGAFFIHKFVGWKAAAAVLGRQTGGALAGGVVTGSTGPAAVGRFGKAVGALKIAGGGVAGAYIGTNIIAGMIRQFSGSNKQNFGHVLADFVEGKNIKAPFTPSVSDPLGKGGQNISTKTQTKEFNDMYNAIRRGEMSFKRLKELMAAPGNHGFTDDQAAALRKLSASMPALRNSFARMRKGSVTEVKELRSIVTGNFATIANVMGAKSEKGAAAVAKNTGLAVKTVKQFMKDGTLTTKQGMAQIEKVFRAEMALYGISGNQANADAHARAFSISTGGDSSTNNDSHAHARGGWVRAAAGGFIGGQGERGRDSEYMYVPEGQPVLNSHHQAALGFNSGGMVPVVLGRGEYLPSPSEVPELNARASAAGYGGLDGLFGAIDRPHYMAKGGKASHATRLLAAMNRVSAKNWPYHLGGGHEQPAHLEPFDCSGAVSYVTQQAGYKVPTSVSGGMGSWPFPRGGGAATIFYNPVHTFMKAFGRFFGTSGFARPGGGAGWFNQTPSASYLSGFKQIHLPNLGGADSGLGSVSAPKVKGPKGALKSVVQGAINRATHAANLRLHAAIAASGGGGGQALEAAGNYNGPLNRVFPRMFVGQKGAHLSSKQVSGLATKAGLPGQTFDQIAHGESDRHPGMQQRDPGDGNVGYGLWQMTPNAWGKGSAAQKYMQRLGGIPQMFNPWKNALMAKYLFHAAGNSIGPWKGTKYVTGGGGPSGSRHGIGGFARRMASGGIAGGGPGLGTRSGGPGLRLTATLRGVANTAIALAGAHQQATELAASIKGLKDQLRGHGTDSAKYALDQVAVISTEVESLSGDRAKLKALYRKALANHNRKLAEKLKEEIAGLDETILTARVQAKGLIDGLKDQLGTTLDATATKMHTAIDDALKATLAGLDAKLKADTAAVDTSAAGLELKGLTDAQAADARAAEDKGQQKSLADAQYLANHSGGKAKADALQAVADAQKAIDDTARQRRIDDLSKQVDDTKQHLTETHDAEVDAANKKAEDDGTAIDAETEARKTGYGKQLDALYALFTSGKEGWTQYVNDVNAILGPLGLGTGGPPIGQLPLTPDGQPAWFAPQLPPKAIHPIPKAILPPKQIGAHASGGTSFGEYAWVGELGRELVHLPRGAQVSTASDSRGQGGGTTVNFYDARIGSQMDLQSVGAKLAHKIAFAG